MGANGSGEREREQMGEETGGDERKRVEASRFERIGADAGVRKQMQWKFLLCTFLSDTSGKMHLILHPFVTFATFANFFVQFCTI